MKLVEKVPKDLYKIFGSKYMEFYMQFLVALYEESSQSYSLLGLTERECQMMYSCSGFTILPASTYCDFKRV